MKRINIIFILFAAGCLLLSPVAGAEDENGSNCVRPEKTPAIPDGRRSTESEMKEAMQKVRDYLAANQAFRECLGKLLEKNDDQVSENLRKGATRLMNETLETDELLGDLFNQQVRVYKAANPDY